MRVGMRHLRARVTITARPGSGRHCHVLFGPCTCICYSWPSRSLKWPTASECGVCEKYGFPSLSSLTRTEPQAYPCFSNPSGKTQRNESGQAGGVSELIWGALPAGPKAALTQAQVRENKTVALECIGIGGGCCKPQKTGLSLKAWPADVYLRQV